MRRQQFVSLVESEQEALRRFLLTLCCGNGDDADDIAQETFIRAYLSLDGYDERNRAGLWLRKIAYNIFLNYRKSRMRHGVGPLEDASCVAGEGGADDGFRYQELEAALAELSRQERTAVVLHYIEGYQINEISQITGCSESAVKKQLQRAREELKRRIER